MSNGFDTLDDLPTIQGDDGKESKLLANRYKIIRKLGEGGMGMVYLAEDAELGNSKVAIKFIPPQLAGNLRAIKNLKKEAQTAMLLSHRNIVRLHDLHTDGHQKFLVMEYIEGKTIEEALAEKEDDKFAVEELLPIAEQIAAALDYAHKSSVLHRDLKPSNIMITSEGKVKLLDFSIARELKDSYTRVTGQETSGTLPYMSPEQLRGKPPSPSMDIYSFAAVLYECLCGHPPFHTGDLRHQILEERPAELAGVPECVNEALQLSMSKAIEKRPRNTSELVSMLKGQKESSFPKAATAEKTGNNTLSKRLIPIVIICFAIVVAAFALLKYKSYKEAQRQEVIRKQQVERARLDQLEKERQARLERKRKLREQQAAEQKRLEQKAELARQEQLEKERQEKAKQQADQERRRREIAKKRAEEEAARKWEGTITDYSYKPIAIDGRTLYVSLNVYSFKPGTHLQVRKKPPVFLLDDSSHVDVKLNSTQSGRLRPSSGSGHFELDGRRYGVKWEDCTHLKGGFVIYRQ
jgi:serine/threonine protein kinase